MPRRVSSLLRPSLSPLLLLCSCAFLAAACSHQSSHDPLSVRFLIESNPANLDPRFATDAQSQRIDGLLFSGLVERDNQMEVHPDVAESWDQPDPLTYVFHLRPGVRFHDGRPLTSADVKSTFDFMMDPANRSPKRGAFRMVKSVEAPDANTVVFHLSEPSASFLWNLARPAVGIVPANAPQAADFAKHPIGTGPFKFVSQAQDDAVVLERNDRYFRQPPHLEKITFQVVPDAVVRALELRKGSADIEMSSLSADMIPVLSKRPELQVSERPGTSFAYLGFNLEDPILKHREVRQALAYATDREAIIRYLLHGQAKLASGLIPPNHWAYEPAVTRYAYDPKQAEALLDAAGYPRQQNSKRFHLALKVSTEEQARLIGAALQEQWSKVGVELEVRPLEIATLFSDLGKGNFQISYLRWIGANNDPDVFDMVFSSKRFPPDGANRGHYRNTKMDELTAGIRTELDREKRKTLTSDAQKLAAEDLPYLPLWYADIVSVHRKSLGDIDLSPGGDYDFLAKP